MQMIRCWLVVSFLLLSLTGCKKAGKGSVSGELMRFRAVSTATATTFHGFLSSGSNINFPDTLTKWEQGAAFFSKDPVTSAAPVIGSNAIYAGTVSLNGEILDYGIPYYRSIYKQRTRTSGNDVWNAGGENGIPPFTFVSEAPWPSIDSVTLPDTIFISKGCRILFKNVRNLVSGSLLIGDGKGMAAGASSLQTGDNEVVLDPSLLSHLTPSTGNAFISWAMTNTEAATAGGKNFLFSKNRVAYAPVEIRQ